MGKILHTLKNTNTERQLFQRRVIALIAGVFINSPFSLFAD
jgi:hypothetical protein